MKIRDAINQKIYDGYTVEKINRPKRFTKTDEDGVVWTATVFTDTEHYYILPIKIYSKEHNVYEDFQLGFITDTEDVVISKDSVVLTVDLNTDMLFFVSEEEANEYIRSLQQ